MPCREATQRRFCCAFVLELLRGRIHSRPLFGKCFGVLKLGTSVSYEGVFCSQIDSGETITRASAVDWLPPPPPAPSCISLANLNQAGFAFVACVPAAQMKVKMEDMAQEFGDMLKETLDRMRERIEVKPKRECIPRNVSSHVHTKYICMTGEYN